MGTGHGITGLLPHHSAHKAGDHEFKMSGLRNEILSQRKQDKCCMKRQQMHTQVIKMKAQTAIDFTY